MQMLILSQFVDQLKPQKNHSHGEKSQLRMTLFQLLSQPHLFQRQEPRERRKLIALRKLPRNLLMLRRLVRPLTPPPRLSMLLPPLPQQSQLPPQLSEMET